MTTRWRLDSYFMLREQTALQDKTTDVKALLFKQRERQLSCLRREERMCV